MNTPVGTTRRARPTLARNLETTIRWLRTEEPRCTLAERTHVMTKLALLSIDVERMILRNELRHAVLTDSDDAERREIERHADRLRRLMTYWPEPVDARTSVPPEA